MKTEFVKFKSDVPYSDTVVNRSPAPSRFDWDATLKVEPDPFFDSTRWIGTVGGQEIGAALCVPGTKSENAEREGKSVA
jgi:hypothetical protein